jgi:hypothetical protein
MARERKSPLGAVFYSLLPCRERYKAEAEWRNGQSDPYLVACKPDTAFKPSRKPFSRKEERSGAGGVRSKGPPIIRHM